MHYLGNSYLHVDTNAAHRSLTSGWSKKRIQGDGETRILHPDGNIKPNIRPLLYVGARCEECFSLWKVDRQIYIDAGGKNKQDGNKKIYQWLQQQPSETQRYKTWYLSYSCLHGRYMYSLQELNNWLIKRRIQGVVSLGSCILAGTSTPDKRLLPCMTAPAAATALRFRNNTFPRCVLLLLQKTACLCNSPGYSLSSQRKQANNCSFEVGSMKEEEEELELGLDSSDHLPVCSLVQCGVGIVDGEMGGLSVGLFRLSVGLFQFPSGLLLVSSKRQGRWPCWESRSPELMHSHSLSL